MAVETPFKECSCCSTSWESLAAFVLDSELTLEGYQPSFADPFEGWLLLTHNTPDCKTTLAVRTAQLRDLYDGPEYTERRTGTPGCPWLCIKENRLEECTMDCDMAWVRQVMQYLRRHALPAHLAAEEAQ
jgi:hypothetical protein